MLCQKCDTRCAWKCVNHVEVVARPALSQDPLCSISVCAQVIRPPRASLQMRLAERARERLFASADARREDAPLRADERVRFLSAPFHSTKAAFPNQLQVFLRGEKLRTSFPSFSFLFQLFDKQKHTRSRACRMECFPSAHTKKKCDEIFLFLWAHARDNSISCRTGS